MPILPKLNLSRAVKIPTDISLASNNNANISQVHQEKTESISNKQDTITSSKISTRDVIPEFSASEHDLISNNSNEQLSFLSNSQDHQSNIQDVAPNIGQTSFSNGDDNTIQSHTLKNCNQEQSSIQNNPSLNPELSSPSLLSCVIVEEESSQNKTDNVIIHLLSLPGPQMVKKRRRTVNKIDQDPEKLPLRDLLFYNPPETIFQKENRESHEEQNETTMKPSIAVKRRTSSRFGSVSSDRSTNDKIEQLIQQSSVEQKQQKDGVDDENTSLSVEEDKAKVPSSDIGDGLLTVDESGNIVLKNHDATSSNQTASSGEIKPKIKSSTTYNSFRRRERSKNLWNAEETGVFYTALEIVGTDFTLMEAVFFKDRGRDRKQLKQKFKREEKINRAYIDEILYKSLRNRSKLKLATFLEEEEHCQVDHDDHQKDEVVDHPMTVASVDPSFSD